MLLESEPPPGDRARAEPQVMADRQGPGEPVPLAPRGDRHEPLVFRQGAHPPYGIRWYGVTSLFGHLRNFMARAIAAESVDPRDWMRPAPPGELLATTLAVLEGPGAPRAPAATLTEALGREVWIDFVADTGDDRDVSAAVGAMLATTYTADDGAGGQRHLPRGDLLVFGGDVAYPVATADEIYRRVVLPWNEELRRRAVEDGTASVARPRRRVVLGVPGNHDWYDVLDGFGRLFRRRMDEPFRADDRDLTTRIGRRLEKRPGRKVGLVARQLHLDEVGGIYGLIVGFFRSVRAFSRGVAVRRRRRLALRGYDPVQEASYFALPLTPTLDLFGADRQLGRVDFRQRSFFTRLRDEHPERGVLFVAGDPALAYGERNEPGARMLTACRLSLDRDRVFYLAGDFHHYERRTMGKALHVIAGGGGAFLHGTRIGRYPKEAGPPDVAYPTAAASRRLVAQVPLKLMLGRAGLLVHWAFALLASIELGAAVRSETALVTTSLLLAALLALALYFVAHEGTQKPRIAMLALPFGAALGLLPMALALALPRLGGAPALASEGAVILASAFVGSLLFGVYLMTLAILGLEHQQAFTVLGHPGFKHFVRLCIHPDGRVEGFTIGKDDMMSPTPPELIDTFTWDAREHGTSTPAPPESE